MIKVDSNFYERGLTMDGKGNRVMLKKSGETFIEMEFIGKKVRLNGMTKGEVYCSETVNFDQICQITIDNRITEPLPAIILY